MHKSYQILNPDYNLSPFTGMTKEHYIQCAKYILERAFTHVPSIEHPMAFPVVPGKTYPQPGDPPWRHRSHEFEALERSFTLAGPLIHIDQETEIRGIKLREYYSRQLYLALTSGHPSSLPLPEDLPDATYQFTCEFGGLFKTLLLLSDVIWADYTKEEKDQMAVTISKWAHHRTTQNNWRIFNIMALSFLKKQGYKIDEELLKSHLLWVVSYHSGNGWYLEQTYNYYTISLFIVYCIIWNRSFGDKYYPEIVRVIDHSAGELMKTFTSFFSRSGHINMWARSICYRTWVAGGFPVSFMMKGEPPLDPGFARRLCSGAILQFVSREDFFHNDIPSLGFYGPKEYMLQNYSCSASPFIMFLPFIALGLPDDSSFWTAKENQGFWEDLERKTKIEVLENPGLVLANHGKTGASEIIPGKVYYDDSNYSKLIYNTDFPWEAPNPGGGTSMEYSLRSLDPRDLKGKDVNFYLTGFSVKNDSRRNERFWTSQSMLYNGMREGILYRQAIMRKPPNNGVGYIIDLADIIIPGGVVRVDRSRLAFEYELTLGHFGLPHIGGRAAEVIEFTQNNRRVLTASIPGRRLALISYQGWDETGVLVHSDNNAEADESTVLYLHKKRMMKNPPMELMICAMLHKTDDSDWTEDELNPIKNIRIKDITDNYSALGAELELADGRNFKVDFVDIDGYRSC